MSNPVSIRDRWGSGHFEPSPVACLTQLPISHSDAKILEEVGLPVTPRKALALFLRYENVNIVHEPKQVVPLIDRAVEKSAHFPRTGHSEIDAWGDLSSFVVLGEVPNDYEAGSQTFLTRFVCLDCVRGCIWWVYPKLREGKTDCSLFNASLCAYLECLLIYREWREEGERLCSIYPDEDAAITDPNYQSLMGTAHRKFLHRLEEADPIGFKEGFWEFHAWNESILFGVA